VLLRIGSVCHSVQLWWCTSRNETAARVLWVLFPHFFFFLHLLPLLLISLPLLHTPFSYLSYLLFFFISLSPFIFPFIPSVLHSVFAVFLTLIFSSCISILFLLSLSIFFFFFFLLPAFYSCFHPFFVIFLPAFYLKLFLGFLHHLLVPPISLHTVKLPPFCHW
jgi:hypothetical protein